MTAIIIYFTNTKQYFMKKTSIFILSFLAVAMTANAQIETEDDGFGQKQRVENRKTTTTRVEVKGKHYNYELSVGLRAGTGVSTMSEGDGLKIYDGSGLSFGGGLAANVRFGGKDSRNRPLDGQGLFGIGLELNYKQHTVKTLADDDLTLGYFEVPVMLQFYPCYNTKHLKNLYIEVGPTITGTMSSSPDKIKVGEITYFTGDLKGFDVKATVGLGYRFNKNSANDGFYANARYYLGTSELAGNFPAKISSLEISIGYLFKCIGTKK